MQETAISSGWGEEFLVLADRCDAAVAAVYNRAAGELDAERST